MEELHLLLRWMALSLPVAFQKPAVVALFVRVPVGYFLSLWLKKYHSFWGPDPILHLSATKWFSQKMRKELYILKTIVRNRRVIHVSPFYTSNNHMGTKLYICAIIDLANIMGYIYIFIFWHSSSLLLSLLLRRWPGWGRGIAKRHKGGASSKDIIHHTKHPRSLQGSNPHLLCRRGEEVSLSYNPVGNGI